MTTSTNTNAPSPEGSKAATSHPTRGDVVASPIGPQPSGRVLGLPWFGTGCAEGYRELALEVDAIARRRESDLRRLSKRLRRGFYDFLIGEEPIDVVAMAEDAGPEASEELAIEVARVRRLVDSLTIEDVLFEIERWRARHNTNAEIVLFVEERVKSLARMVADERDLWSTWTNGEKGRQVRSRLLAQVEHLPDDLEAGLARDGLLERLAAVERGLQS